MNFRIVGLPAADFTDLFSLPEDELRRRSAVRVIADKNSGFPCRVSLTDAAAGDELILVNYEHHRVATPFRSSFAIYVRPGEQTYDEVNQVPEQLRKRLLSLRAYDADGMLVDADVIDGRELESGIERMFSLSSGTSRAAEYLHAHFAKPGCYAARIARA